MNTWPLDYFKEHEPEEVPPMPCNKCTSYRVVYHRCRMQFSSECTATDPLRPSIPCGKNAWSSGQPKLCDMSRTNFRMVNTYCLKWNHYKFTFYGQMWKCCQCQQNGQDEETCQLCAHYCCKECTQGRTPRARQELYPFTDEQRTYAREEFERHSGPGGGPQVTNSQRAAPMSPGAIEQVPDVQAQGTGSSSSRAAPGLPNIQRRDAGPSSSRAAPGLPNIQRRDAGPSSSRAAPGLPNIQRRDAGPSSSGVARQIISAQEPSLSSSSGACQALCTMGRVPVSKSASARRQSLSPRGGGVSAPMSVSRSFDIERRTSGSAPSSASSGALQLESSRRISPPSSRRRYRKQPSPRKAMDAS
jgi:hypothetical protein